MLREKAKDLGKIMKADFDPSPSWITHWREHNLIVFKRKHGEKQNHDSEAAENWTVSVWQKYMSFNLPHKFTTVMRWGFTFVHYQRKLCALKRKNSPVARNQKNALPSYLLQTLMVRTSYTHLLIHAALGENKNSWMTATLFQEWSEWFDPGL